MTFNIHTNDGSVSAFFSWFEQRYGLRGGSESASGRQNNVSYGTTVPEGVELYLYPTSFEAILGPRARRIARKWNRRQACKRQFCSTVCWTWPFLGVSRQNIRRKIKRWIENQHLVLWRGPCSAQRQAWELICGPDLGTTVQLLSFNRTQFRVLLAYLLDITPWEIIYM